MSKNRKPQGLAPAPQKGIAKEIAADRRRAQAADRRQREKMQDEERHAARQRLNPHRMAKPTEEQLLLAHLQSIVTPAQTALLRAWGYDQTVRGTCGGAYGTGQTNAWTDFKTVEVVAGRDLVQPRDGLDKYDMTVSAVASLKGAYQHEFGHLRFTVPFNILKESTEDELGDDSLTGYHQHTWNLLEDQRMEAAVVASVPSIAGYFRVMVSTIVLGGVRTVSGSLADPVNDRAWMYIAGRKYMSDALRLAARDQFAAQHGDPAADRWEEIVATYKAATTNIDLAKTVILAKTFLDELGVDSNRSDHDHRSSDDGRRFGQAEDQEPAKGADPAAGATEHDADGDADGDDDTDSAGGAGASADGDDGDDDDADATGQGGGENVTDDEAPATDTDTDTPSKGAGSGEGLKSLAEQERREAQEEIAEHHDVQAMAQDVTAASSTGDGSEYTVYTGGKREFTADIVASCDQNATAIVQGFNGFLAARSPHMMGGQETGYLDPLAYRTRDIGSRSYRRDMDGEVNQTLDMHLSVLVDNSGSMTGTLMEEASQAIYTLHTAANEIGLPTNFLLWSSSRQVYQVATRDPEPVTYETGGGTWADDAIKDSLNHCDDSVSNHLVVIVTDGSWGGESRYAVMGTERRDNTKYLLVCIGNSTPPDGHSYADATVTISSASQMGPVIESALHALVD